MGHNHGAGAEDCYACGRRAGYNRAIVDPRRGVEIGRVCVNCERDELDERFAAAADSASTTCAYCERERAYELPRYEPIVIESDEAAVSVVSTKLDPNPIGLCERHLRWLGGETSSELATRERTLAG